MKAHSVEEFEEWLMRAEEDKLIRRNMKAQGLMSYREHLLEEYRQSSNEVQIVSHHSSDEEHIQSRDSIKPAFE